MVLRGRYWKLSREHQIDGKKISKSMHANTRKRIGYAVVDYHA